MEATATLIKKRLIVNGQERELLVTGEEFLVDIIRNDLHLTGTKRGCRANQCGICTVLLDNKPIRSCVTKLNRVPDGASIITIEGIGTPDHLHPLQVAWMKYGAAQCGICTPGFIVSAYGLLQVNPNPTRGEVREWFRINRNVCRCTGYKPLVDAVIAAAKVMRGEMDIEELGFHPNPDGRIFGTDYPRPTAIGKVTGTIDYGADTGAKEMKDALRLALVQAEVSHANILSIDTSEAEKMPGVEAVLTYKDVKGTNRIDGLVLYPWNKNDGFDRVILCDKKVFQYGDAIAIVCADTQAHADAAAKKVKVELEELPAYLDAKSAAAPDAIEIHPGVPNVFFEQPIIKGPDQEELFKNAACVVEEEYYSPRQPHLPLEPDVGYAFYDDQGRVEIHSKSVAVYAHRLMIAAGLGLEEDQLRLVQNISGGTFGYKLSPTMEAILGVACMATKKPVYCEFTMKQQITYTGKRSPFFIRAKLACDEKGMLTALEHDVLGDHGAYSEFADLLLTKPLQYIGAGYDIPSIRGMGRMTFTNHAYGAAMRAFGAPPAFFAFESLIDELAYKMHMDPFEFRYQNLYHEGSTCPTGNEPEVLTMRDLFDKLRPRYEEARKIQAEQNKDNPRIRRGVGISVGIYGCSDDGFDTSDAAAELLPDGKIRIFHTWEDHGQGSDMGALACAHEALRPLGIKVEDLDIVANDTATCPNSGYAAGSRSQLMIGNAIADSCVKLMDAMRKEDGTYRTYDEMIAEGIDTKYQGNYCSSDVVTSIDPATLQFSPYPTYMYGAYICEADVDTETGDTKVVRMTGAYDIGRICNKTVVDGQVYGGMLQGIGLALREEFEDFKSQTTLAKCGFPTIDVIPDELEVSYIETPRPNSFFGCSGVGEVVTAGPHTSVTNAIFDACGARLYRMPAYPDRVLEAMPKKG